MRMTDAIRLILIGIIAYAITPAPQSNTTCQPNQQCEVKK